MMLDIQYITDERILTVCQTNNQADPAWVKMGHNQYLSASAIKGETNSITKLTNAYAPKASVVDSLARLNTNANLTSINSNLSYQCDDYDTAAVYKDIDIVNVDIATGEIIGKLSDLTYPFATIL